MAAYSQNAVYDLLAAAVGSVDGMESAGVVLGSQDMGAFRKQRAFWIVPDSWDDLEWYASYSQKRIEETVFVVVNHDFLIKNQDAARAVAMSDSLAVVKAIETDVDLRAASQPVRVTSSQVVLAGDGDYIETTLTVTLNYDLEVA